MTLSELLSDLTARIGVTNGQEISNNQLTFWLNEALRVFCREADFHWLEKSTNDSTLANTQSYSLPSDYKRMVEVQVDATNDDPGVHGFVPWEQRHGVQTGDKRHTIFGSNYYLLPTPTTTGSANIDLYYIRKPANMVDGSDSPSDSDIANMPEEYHPALVTYAFALYNGYDEEASDAQYWLGNPVNPSPGTYNWFVQLAKKDNARQKRGERRKMLSKQAAVGYVRPNQIGTVSQVLKV